MKHLVALVSAACVACLDPLVSDEVERPGLLLPAGTELTPITDSAIMRAQIDRSDGMDDDRLRLRSGFSHGERIWYWDLGEASQFPIPLYLPVAPAEDGFLVTPQGRFTMLPDHPSIFNAVPGDPGYSPWWILVLWPITDKYQGEVISSFEAMDEAFRTGLVGPSITLPLAFNCPIVLPEARMEVVPGDPSVLLAPFTSYYRGHTVTYVGFDTVPLDDIQVSAPPLYVIRREGGEPVSEPLRGVDMTRDGDFVDTNDLFAARPGDAEYSGFVELVEAVVADGEYIDRSGADDQSELMDAAMLFNGSTPDPKRVVALHEREVYLNRPIWQPPPEGR